MTGYTFEVLRKTYIFTKDDKKVPCLEHVGYMNKSFVSTQIAAQYYNTKNPGLPKLSQRLLISSVHEKTNLLYVIRQNFSGLKKTINDFEDTIDNNASDWCLL